MQVKKQQLELDMEQWMGSKLGKEYVNAVYCHPDYLTYMQSTSCEMLGWVKHKLESSLPREMSITSDIQMTNSHMERYSTSLIIKEIKTAMRYHLKPVRIAIIKRSTNNKR